MEVIKHILKKAQKLNNDLKDYLISNLDKFEFVKIDEHTASYNYGDYNLQIWVANSKENTHFYGGMTSLLIAKADYTKEDKEKLWARIEKDKEKSGEVRQITKEQMSNDLYFKFKGVYGEIRFTGYDDKDWWTKHRPEEIKENEDIVWKIDLEKMIATYKKIKK